MKNCEEYAALLDAFAEGDLFTEDMVRVQKHLMDCPDCQAYLEDLLAIRAAFPTVEETEVPEGFSARVMAAVAQTPQPPVSPAPETKVKKAPWGRVLASLAACCAIVILMKTPILGGRGSSAESAASTASYAADSAAVTEECAVETTEETAEAESFSYTAEAAPEAAAGQNLPEEPMETAPAETEMKTVVTTHSTSDGTAAKEAAILADDLTALVLTVQEAGDLLEGFTPVEETEGELLYNLSAQEYIGLLGALPREIRQRAPASTDETMTVIVQK